MSQVMIVAKMQPQHASEVADIFTRYDATDMPYEIGVTRRSLFQFHDVYVHLIDFGRPVGEAMTTAQRLPSFRAVSEELRPFISAYDPGWTSPADAMAARFYRWTARGPEAEPAALVLPRRALAEPSPTSH